MISFHSKRHFNSIFNCSQCQKLSKGWSYFLCPIDLKQIVNKILGRIWLSILILWNIDRWGHWWAHSHILTEQKWTHEVKDTKQVQLTTSRTIGKVFFLRRSGMLSMPYSPRAALEEKTAAITSACERMSHWRNNKKHCSYYMGYNKSDYT